MKSKQRCPANRTLSILSPARMLAASAIGFASISLAIAQEEVGITDEEVFELSPFEIVTDSNVGYLATSSLAGSRLKTDLKDISAAISVVTPEFMADTGSTNLEDILIYTVNTEVSGVGGNFGTRSGSTRIRGLNSADVTRDFFVTDISMDSYNTSRLDIQRGPNSILFGLGSPAGIINSTLNTPNMDSNRNKAKLQVDQYGSLRTVLDVDRTIVKNVLGVRVNLMDDHSKYQQDGKFNRDRRVYAVGRWTPKLAAGIYTQLQVSYEKGKVKANRPDLTPPTDLLSSWFTYGQKWTDDSAIRNPRAPTDIEPYLSDGPGGVWYNGIGLIYGDPNSAVIGGAGIPEGFVQRGGEPLYGWYSSGAFTNGQTFAPHILNTAAYYSNNAKVNQIISNYESMGYTFNGFGSALWSTQAITDRSVFDYLEETLSGPNDRQWADFDALKLSFTQTYFDGKLGIDVVYDKQHKESGNESLMRGAGHISIDVNEELQDGAPNPNLGRPFVATTSGGSDGDVDRESFHAMAYYNLDFSDLLKNENWLTSILGEHTFTGVYSRQRHQESSRDYNLYMSDDDYLATYKDGIGYEVLTQVHYLGESMMGASTAQGANISGVKTVHRPPSSFSSLVVDTNSQWSYADVGSVYFRDNGVNLYTDASEGYDDTESKSFTWQGKFFDGALVTLWGWRNDKYERWDKPSGLPLDEYSYPLPYSEEWNYDDIEPLTADESRVSWGVVLHTPKPLQKYLPDVVDDLSVFFNKSSNFRPSDVSIDVYGNPIDPPSGETEEYGFAVTAFDERVSLRATWYKTTQANTPYTGTRPDLFWVRNDNIRTMRGMMIETNAGYGVEQMTPNWLVNDWMFGEGNWDESTASEPIPDDWENIPGILDQPLRIRASMDPNSATFVEPYTVDPVNGTDYAPHITVTEREYRRAWFLARADAEWFRPLDPGLVDVFGYQQDKNSTGVTWIQSGAPSSMQFVNDLESTGVEVELTMNITKNWRLMFNMAKQDAKRSGVMDDFDQVIENNLDFWLDGYSEIAATSIWDMDGFADIRFFGNNRSQALGLWAMRYIYLPYLNAKQTEGLSVDEMRKWRWNMVTNYDFTEGALKGVNVGGAARWQDSAVIGYYPKYFEEGDVWINDLDSPIEADAELNIDLWVGYKRMIYNNKIDWNIKLNVRNAFSDEEYIPVSSNPDGTIAGVRIAPQRYFQLSSSFEF